MKPSLITDLPPIIKPYARREMSRALLKLAADAAVRVARRNGRSTSCPSKVIVLLAEGPEVYKSRFCFFEQRLRAKLKVLGRLAEWASSPLPRIHVGLPTQEGAGQGFRPATSLPGHRRRQRVACSCLNDPATGSVRLLCSTKV